MVQCTNLLGQILNLVPRVEFSEIVREHKAERGSKGFSCWDQFVSMLFCQLGQAHSLREIVGGLGSMLGKKVHVGLKRTPKRSTLAYANAHRPWAVYQDVFYALLHRGRDLLNGHLKRPLRFKNPMLSMDASVIDLCLSLFPWAKYQPTKGAVKLHLLLDHEGYLPVFAHLTSARTHEIRVGRSLSFPKGSVVAFDRGYNDYDFFADLCEDEVSFVTRMKSNACYEVVEERRLPQRRSILRDEVIRLQDKTCPYLLRRIEVWDEEKQDVIVLLTNHLDFGATTIAAIYKERWQIEVFFKALKQNLRVKTFVGTSKNALYTQIWTALIAILMLKIMALRSRLGWSLSTLAALLRWNLFAYRDLWDWVDNPYGPPPYSDLFEQPGLFDSFLGQHFSNTAEGASS